MENVVIIGGGQLGSRHLQGLSLVNDAMNIYVVDPSEESLTLCEKRLNEVNQSKNKTLYLCSSINEIPSSIYFAIISTNSKQRFNALEQLLKIASVKYLLLEKFLFPFLEEYEKATQLLSSVETEVFVNCAKRMWPNIVELKEKLNNKPFKHITLKVEGENWNLASNAIHYIDLLLYLTDDHSITLDSNEVSDTVYENKRAGYVEFSGTLKGKTSKGHSFELKCSKDSDDFSMLLKIEVDEDVYEIDEIKEYILLNGTKAHFKQYFQSRLTNIILEQLMETDNCNLPNYDFSKNIHLDLLEQYTLILNGRKGLVT